jgi:hypothetical protein
MPATPGHRRKASLSEALRGLGDMGAGVLRGAVTSYAGGPGDMEDAARSFLGSKSARFLPTSEEISDYLPQTGADTKTVETLGGFVDPKRLVNALRGKGAATVAKAISVPAGAKQAKEAVSLLKRGDDPDRVWRGPGAYRVPTAPMEVSAPSEQFMAREIPTTGVGMNSKHFMFPANRPEGQPLRLKEGEYEFRDLFPGYDQMYKDFPHVAKLPVVAKSAPGDSFGHYDPSTSSLHLNPETLFRKGKPGDTRKTAFHELQHHFQDLNGWPGGADPDWMKFDPRAQAALSELLRDPDLMKHVPQSSKRLMESVGNRMDNPYRAYTNEFGEQQAFGTAVRDKMTPIQRELTSPLKQGYTNPAGGYTMDQYERMRQFANEQAGIAP